MQKISESTNEILHVKKLSEFATLPVRGSPLAAGFDLAAAYDIVIPAHGKGIAKTDLAMKIPTTCYGRIAPRSGLAWKKHIDVGAGVIDADYRGNVGVVLFNHGEEDLIIKKGDRVAQLVLERISMMPCQEVEDLDATERGAGGFGSTGVSESISNC
jgi:deoxyuridine 5'-triphosphate nucleotidohydrolase